MRRFTVRALREARNYAATGGQALHLMPASYAGPYAPACFRGRPIAHLFDQDRARLVATAKRLGVRVCYVDRDGTSDQHIDLVGKPLEAALRECEVDP